MSPEEETAMPPGWATALMLEQVPPDEQLPAPSRQVLTFEYCAIRERQEKNAKQETASSDKLFMVATSRI